LSGGRRPDDVRGWLEFLRSHLAALEKTAGIDHLVAGLSDAVAQIMVEHSGMAEELLSVYEQLGMVFEVTRGLPSVQEESEVLGLFLDSLSRSFREQDVFLAHPPIRNLTGRWRVQGSRTEIDEWLQAQLERVRREKTAIVETPSATATSDSLAAEVMIGPVFSGEHFVCAVVITRGKKVTEFHASDMLVIESLSTFCGDLIRNHRLVKELREMSVVMVRSLVSAVDQKDQYTSGHSVRVAYFATLLGKELNVDEDDLQMLQWGALLHDVGKIGIRDGVLKKKGRLSEDEWEHIREHPIRSYRVVKDVPQLTDALEGVLHHHEHYDGSGYPSQLAHEGIPLQARIIQIADVFDALTSTRSYRPAFDWQKALSILEEEAGKTVDPYLQKSFDRVIRETLENDPGAWERMVQSADQFAPVS
jgi:HD-GYP domain-containing protein (c-di-GMP phosphodiesterase class II)